MARRSSVTLYWVQAELYWRAKSAATASCLAVHHLVSFVSIIQQAGTSHTIVLANLSDTSIQVLHLLKLHLTLWLQRGNHTCARRQRCMQAYPKVSAYLTSSSEDPSELTWLNRRKRKPTLHQTCDLVWMLVRQDDIYTASISELHAPIAENKGVHGVVPHRSY
jgi:hypothetical protein